MSEIEVLVNGEPRRLPAEHASVQDLLSLLSLQDRRHLAVECNKVIVPKDQFEHTRLQQGDRLEIVSFVGGG